MTPKAALRPSMAGPPGARNPQAVLFACGFNSVRSPMAESLLKQMFPHALYVKSAGVRKGELDPFAVAVMAELGQDISGHKPMTFEELEDWEGLNFDLIITLSPEAHHKALELTRTRWRPMSNTGRRRTRPRAEGSREQKLEAYREVCDGLMMRIRKRFFAKLMARVAIPAVDPGERPGPIKRVVRLNLGNNVVTAASGSPLPSQGQRFHRVVPSTTCSPVVEFSPFR